MSYIITIDSESKETLDLVKYLKSLDFVKVKKETKKSILAKSNTFNVEQQAFKKRMRKNLQQVELLKKGQLKTQSLDDFLTSL